MSDRVKSLISSQNQTQKKFAANIGISPARLNNYLSGVSNMPQELIIKVADVFHVSLTWLLTGEGEMYNTVPARDPIIEKFISIPVVAPIAAGHPIEVYQDEPLEIIQIPVSLLHLPPPYFAFLVEGDSMSPSIMDGDIVVLSRDWRGLKLHNRICGFLTPDGITLKKMVIQSRQKTTWLMPLNHGYEPVPYNKDTEECSFFGVIVISIRKYM